MTSLPIDVDRIETLGFGLSDDLDPFDTGWHCHNKHQILYAGSGALRLEVEDAQWLLPPQRAAWIRAGAQHRVEARAPVQLRTVYLAADVTQGPSQMCRVFVVTPLARHMLLHAMRWGSEHDGAAELPRRYFKALGALVEEWAEEALPFRLPTGQTPELKAAIAHTLNHLDSALTLKAVAQAAGVSSRTLARRFQDEVHMSWKRFQHDARMMQAMALLAAPGARVTDVGLSVGFESPAAFSRAFEAFCGESPSTYRKRVSNPEID